MKNILIVVMVFVCASCRQHVKLSFNQNANNTTFIKNYFQTFNNHNWDSLAKFYADTAAFKDPSFGNKIVMLTHTNFIKKYKNQETIIPNIKDSDVAIYSSSDSVIIVEFKATITDPANKKMELPICTIFTLKNNLIIKDYTYFDNF